MYGKKIRTANETISLVKKRGFRNGITICYNILEILGNELINKSQVVNTLRTFVTCRAFGPITQAFINPINFKKM